MAKLMLSAFGHGGDYNPDQWLDYPEVLEQDVELMKKAHVNLVSVAIFAWSALEPEEGRYETAWLRKIIDRLYENGISVLLATPSGARPAWMSVNTPRCSAWTRTYGTITAIATTIVFPRPYIVRRCTA